MKKQRKKQDRREFLKKTVIGITGISLLRDLSEGKSQKRDEKNLNENRKIVYRTLGQTDIRVPVVSLGASNLHVTIMALDSGISYFDTAYYYGSGGHETMLGNILKGRPRDSFFIATKIQGQMDYRTGLPSKQTSSAQFKAEFKKKTETSLKRLQLDYVDILFVHGVKNSKLIGFEPLKKAMQELKKEGKTRFVGTSFHQKEVLLINTTVKEKIYDVILTAYNFRQPHREEVKKAIAYAAKAGLGVVAMKTMAGVYWDKERKHPINAKASLKWILQDENVHTTIPGISTFDQLELDMSVMEDLTLTPKEQEDLKLGQKTAISGLYCAQCNRCRLQCRYNLDIPTLMRSYMYAYGYKNPAKARETLQFLDLSNLACNRCPTCHVQCTMGFDVRDKVTDIARIKHVPKEFLV
jgi:predicted aldo/keto reductase-like oxidoreductase